MVENICSVQKSEIVNIYSAIVVVGNHQCFDLAYLLYMLFLLLFCPPSYQNIHETRDTVCTGTALHFLPTETIWKSVWVWVFFAQIMCSEIHFYYY